MTPQSIIEHCSSVGVVVLLNGSSVRLRGVPEAIEKVSGIIRQHKAAIVKILTAEATNALVREFMEVDGMSLEEAQALAAVSVLPRPPVEWIAMITELDSLIDRYCTLTKASQASRDSIMNARAGQALVNIPATLAWFRRQVAELEGSI